MAPANYPDVLDSSRRAMIRRSIDACDQSAQLLRRTTELLHQSHEGARFTRQQSPSSRFLVLRRSYPQIRDDFNRCGFDFLMVDLETGIAFATRAAHAQADAETRMRNTKNARKAYNCATQFRKRLVLSSGQQKGLDEKQVDLRKALKKLGEHIDPVMRAESQEIGPHHMES